MQAKRLGVSVVLLAGVFAFTSTLHAQDTTRVQQDTTRRQVPESATGIEYMYGAQRTTGDALGQASRVQWMFRLDF